PRHLKTRRKVRLSVSASGQRTDTDTTNRRATLVSVISFERGNGGRLETHPNGGEYFAFYGFFSLLGDISPLGDHPSAQIKPTFVLHEVFRTRHLHGGRFSGGCPRRPGEPGRDDARDQQEV